MDPSLLQPTLRPLSSDEVKPSLSDGNHHPFPSIDGETDYDSHDLDSHDEDPNGDNVDPKRPRLRLAHACDRCRKRKIRCDTQQPCGPCQATKNECTFMTPSRRVVKPKSSLLDGRDRHSNGTGVKRTHSMAGGSLGTSGQSQATLEARLATLESMLRDVPPNVHNAFLSTLDARLGSGTGVGLKEGGTEGVGVSVEALASGVGPFATDNFSFDLGGTSTPWLSASNGINPLRARNGSNPTLSTGWTGSTELWNQKSREEAGVNEMARRMEGLSFFYEDEIGQAKWQGATSGFPLLDLLTAANAPPDPEAEETTSPSFTETFDPSPGRQSSSPGQSTTMPPPSTNRRTSSHSAIPVPPNGRPGNLKQKGRSVSVNTAGTSPERKKKSRFFPDRTPRPSQTLNPEASWKVITGVIPPDLMDTLVRCYLSTSHLLWPFLHVPSFLADYANPQQWGEPGFACFIVAVCTLSSRHVDDPRVRANPSDPSTAGKQYFELFKRLRDLPSADRPTLYSIQAAFLAAIFAFGLGNLSKAFALQAESVTLCLDGGLHRSVDGYDHFDLVEKETRKRTFWSIYSWDKQSAALFGRPPIIHLRDCDVTEPLIIDDENLTPEGATEQVNENTSRICAFVAAIRLHVILEGVIDSSVQPSTFPTSPFLAQAASTIAKRTPKSESLRDEEALLEEWTRILPKYWHYDSETVESRDPIRITQAERLHCLEHLVKMIIYRHRFSGFVALPASTTSELERHLDLCRKAMQCALTIIADHVHISQRGMMTYYGVHVIHQLAQAGRTLVAVVLNCKNKDFRPLISPSVEGLRSCVGLLRRFSGRYLCGLRSADIIDEFCRICNIPVDSPRVPDGSGRPSPAWLRPVRRRPSPSPSRMQSSTSPTAILDNPSAYPTNNGNGYPIDNLGDLSADPMPADLEALFNTSEYFDIAAMEGLTSPQTHRNSLPASNIGMPTSTSNTNISMSNNTFNTTTNLNNTDNTWLPTLGEPSAPYDRFETLTPNDTLGSGSIMLGSFDGGSGMTGMGGGNDFAYTGMNGFDLGNGGMGVDSVADGLTGGENPQQGLSAATILSLMQEGTFDYGSIFTDQAP